MYAELLLSYNRIIALIVAFNTEASLQRVCDCSRSEESLSFCDRKSDTNLQI